MVAILYLCTGKYSLLFQQFYEACSKYFLPGITKHFYVITDSTEIKGDNVCVITVSGEVTNRRLVQMKKNELFSSLERRIVGHYNYVFAPNANLIFKEEINPQDILPDKSLGQTMVCTAHLQFKDAFFDDNVLNALFRNTESNPESKAYIGSFPYQYCWSNAVTGGEPEDFFEMTRTLASWANEDMEKGIVPIWHDESYFNKYRLLNASKFRILGTTYGWPEIVDNVVQEEKYKAMLLDKYARKILE